MSKRPEKVDKDSKIREQLRKRAEELIRKRVGDVDPEKLTVEEARRLVHELQVHQIELEMQNEELRNAQIEIEEAWRKYIDLYDFSPLGYFTFDREGLIIEVNLTGAILLGVERPYLIKKSFTTYVERDYQDSFYFHRKRVFESEENQTCELKLKKKDGVEFYARLDSVSVPTKQKIVCRTSVSDVTERRRADKEREMLVAELQEALANVKVLKGLLPICAWCGRVRDDNGYWDRVESYVEQHTDARFTHGICPECQGRWDGEAKDIRP